MKRKLIALLALCLAMAVSGCAVAEVYTASSPELTWVKADEAFLARGFYADEDGNVVVLGQLLYPDEPMLERYDMEGEYPPAVTDAFAVALTPDGETIWEYRIRDISGENSFRDYQPIGEGQYLLAYQSRLGAMGQLQYIVEDGKIVGMLPMEALRRDGTDYFLYVVAGGYLGGGCGYDDGLVYGMDASHSIVRYDEEMNELWRIAGEDVKGGMFMHMREVDAGYLFTGDDMGPGATYRPSAMLVSKDGEILWRFTGHKYAATSITDGWQVSDGGYLLAAMNDPTLPTPYDKQDAASLTKLDANGEHLWTREYYDECGMTVFYGMCPFGDGFVLMGSMEDYYDTGVLYVDEAGEPKGFFAVSLIEDKENRDYTSSVSLAAGADGAAYLYGEVAKYFNDEEAGRYDLSKSNVFYMKIEESMFTQ